jgi:hypothetical protein
MVKETLQPNLVAKASNSKELPSDTIGSDLTSSLNRFFKDINFIFFIDSIRVLVVLFVNTTNERDLAKRSQSEEKTSSYFRCIVRKDKTGSKKTAFALPTFFLIV